MIPQAYEFYSFRHDFIFLSVVSINYYKLAASCGQYARSRARGRAKIFIVRARNVKRAEL